MEVSESLRKFIIKATFIDDIKITPDTVIETEFGITGNDSDDFIIAFGKEFNVDVSKFEIGKYFKGEGDTTLSFIFDFFRSKKTQEKHHVLTVGDLERAIAAGKLDSTVIKDK